MVSAASVPVLPSEQLDRVDPQGVGKDKHAVEAWAVSAVLDAVDGLAVEPGGLGQRLLCPVDLLAKRGHPVAETRAVLR